MTYANISQIIFKIKQNIPWNEVEKYTKKLRGGLVKAKANYGQVIGEMIENAQNRRWVENKDEKQKMDASGGWYRHDVAFTILIDDAGTMRRNAYQATAVVRIKKDKLYLYDIINIKKETSTPL